jgi:DNA-binding transcriptional MocR family regulator
VTGLRGDSDTTPPGSGAPADRRDILREFCYSTVMSSDSVQYTITGRDAASVARSIERGVTTGQLEPGAPLPSVRGLARTLGLSPSTIAASYQQLRQRGLVVGHDRSRTTVAHRPPLALRLAPDLPPGVVDLATGNPDPRLLPDLGPLLAQVVPTHRLYGDDAHVAMLMDMAREVLGEDGVPIEHLAVTGGGLDGIERVLEVHCRVGDRVLLEDPCYIGLIDLVRTLGLEPIGIAIDDEGPRPEALADALDRGARAAVLVPRAQNPTGAALTVERAAALRALLADHPDLLVVEDDPLGVVSGVDLQRIGDDRAHWAYVRSLSKALGPDLRVAIVAADEDTIIRLRGRQRLGTGWVSHLLQQLAALAWREARAGGVLTRAAAAYRARSEVVLDALAAHDLEAHGRSGLNVWVPVVEEVPVVQGLAARGWGVQAGEPFRIDADPGIRITTAALEPDDAAKLSADLVEVLGNRLGTRRG